MTAYIVTHEIKDTKRLEAVVAHLRSYGFYCPIHQNAYAVVVNKTALQITNELNSLISPTIDRLFVIRSGTEAAWIHMYGEKHVDWLKKYL